MGNDQVTYQRATMAARVGFLVQAALTVGMALGALWAQSPALQVAAWHFGGGLLLWLVLLLLYSQHRIERQEALEAERLTRGDAASAAIFAEHADDLDLARRRLQRLYKYGLGIVSIVTALYLIIAGGIWEYYNLRAYRSGSLFEHALGARALASPMMVVVLTAAPAFLAFIIARYVAGMTKVSQWQLLRGGASYLMGVVVVSGLAFVGAIFAAFESQLALGYLALVLPALMALIGMEMLLTFLLSAYRPRKPGEVPRPAFDSRVLGWFTSPESLGKIISETVNYQFGFEISRSWFYQLLGRSVTKLVIFGLAVLLLLSCLVIVAPQQEAVITSCGALSRVVGPGPHLKLPWPLGRVLKFDVLRVHKLTAGSSVSKQDPNIAILWTNPHTEGEEGYMLTSPTPSAGRGSVLAGQKSDYPASSLLAAELVLHYKIKNLEEYVRGAENPDATIKALADRRLTEYFVTHHDDELLARGRVEVGKLLLTQLQKDAEQLKLGVNIVFVSLISVHPPSKSEVAASYHEQIAALQERESTIQGASREANQVLAEVAGSRDKAMEIYQSIHELELLRQPQEGQSEAQRTEQLVLGEDKVEKQLRSAQGRAAELIYDATAYRWDRAVNERAKAERFASELLAYQQAPEFYRMRSYLNTLAEGMANARKIVLTVQEPQAPIFRLDLKESQSTLDTLLETK